MSTFGQGQRVEGKGRRNGEEDSCTATELTHYVGRHM